MDHLLRVELRSDIVDGALLEHASITPDTKTAAKLKDGACRARVAAGRVDIFGSRLLPFETGVPLGFDLLIRSPTPLIISAWEEADFRMVAPMGTLAHRVLGNDSLAAHLALPWTASGLRPKVVTLHLPTITAQITWHVVTLDAQRAPYWVQDQDGVNLEGTAEATERPDGCPCWSFTTADRFPVHMVGYGTNSAMLVPVDGAAPLTLPQPAGESLRQETSGSWIADVYLYL